MNVTIKGVSVKGIASAIPPEIEDLRDLDIVFGQEEINRIIKTNGIEKIRKAPEGICTSDLCINAAAELLKDKDPACIDALVFVSQTSDYILPATSCVLQQRLGLTNEVVAIDINQGCSGYIYGLYQAAMMVSTGGCRNVLMCAGDVLSRHVSQMDKNERMVFGDAGSATILSRGEGEIGFSFHTEGSGAKNLIIPAGGSRMPIDETTSEIRMREDGAMRSDEDLFMNGIEVMNFSLRQVPKTIAGALAVIGWSHDEVTLFGLHQANKFMLDYLRKILKVPVQKLPVSMSQTGNTSAASIPLMLCLEEERFLAEGMLSKSVLCGFGVGLTCAAAAIDLSETVIHKPVELKY